MLRSLLILCLLVSPAWAVVPTKLPDTPVHPVANVAALSASSANRFQDGDLVRTAGYTTAGDGGGNLFVYHSTGRSGITAAAGTLINGPRADDYFEALNRSGELWVEQCGATGDGTTDDTAALNAAFLSDAATVRLRKAVYKITGPVYAPRPKLIIGAGPRQTRITHTGLSSTTDLFLVGTLGEYATLGDLQAAVGSLQDGYYRVNDTQYYRVTSGSESLAFTAEDGTLDDEQAGHHVADLAVIGSATLSGRHAIRYGGWGGSFHNVHAKFCGGSCLYVDYALDLTLTDCRLDACGGHVADLDTTTSTLTTITFNHCYIRRSDDGAGIKASCLALSLRDCIFEAIGNLSAGVDETYYPGIWITGGQAEISNPYFEDVTGHDVYCNAGVTRITGGNYGIGTGENQALYSMLYVDGSAVVDLAGAIYYSGGGNKTPLSISGAATGWVRGGIYAEPVVVPGTLAAVTDYTAATYDVADITARDALTPSTSETAFVQSNKTVYKYSGSAWETISANGFRGEIDGYGGSPARGRKYGYLNHMRTGYTSGEIVNIWTRSWDAAAGADNYTTIQSGDSVGANATVTVDVTLDNSLNEWQSQYAGSTSFNYLAQAHVSNIPSGLSVHASINSATAVRLHFTNHTGSPVSWSSDPKGSIVVYQIDANDNNGPAIP